jgi:DNA-binding beta-propeller fold protein YncE
MATTTKPRRRTRPRAAALLALAAMLLLAPVAWALGELSQKLGTAGCISEDGSGGLCQNGKALQNAFGVATSPDGKSAYVASAISGAVAIFDRDRATGALTQKPGTAGCVSENGTGGACQDGTALDGAAGVATSRDGKSAYVVSLASDAVALVDRDRPPGR